MARSVAISVARAGDRRIHRVERAGDRAQRHRDRQRPAKFLNQIGGLRGLFGEVSCFGFDIELQPRIVVAIAFELIERGRPGEARAHGLYDIVAIEQALHHVEIGPDLGFEHAAAGLEHADHGPARGAERHGAAEVESLEFPQQGLADHHLVAAAVEHAACGDGDALAQRGCPVRRSRASAGWPWSSSSVLMPSTTGVEFPGRRSGACRRCHARCGDHLLESGVPDHG